ncbi:tyrosine-protein phosphatase non-receptor type 23b [Salminus brasiliensis]|uniref:tyrosine-protein phosphatase non-receptor type 23b n=1 Tax=Salminus brasiliensis TaxID=930266 RepID=UPI003B834BAB
MEAVPRMPMIWLELKEAGEFQFAPAVRQYIQRNYGESPENYSEALKKLEQLRQNVVNVPRDFEGCSMLRKYFGQLHFLHSRVPMAKGQEAAVPVTWMDIFSGKQVTHEDISYEQACVLYNLGALHSFLGAMDNRVSEEGMKTSCTHFQCSAGAFTYIRDHYNFNYSSDISHQALSINTSLMLAQAQECLLEKTLLDNRKSVLVARICAQVCEYYKECVRVLENAEGTFGKKEWRKLIYMKISYFSAVTHLHMGKQSEEQQKFGEAVAYFQAALDRLNEAIKLSKGQPDSVQAALRFTMDVIGGKFNSARKDNDFIYHETVPNLDTLAVVKGASLVKPLPVSPTDLGVTGPDLFSKLVPMATHEASSLYSEEKAKMLREVMAKIDDKNQTLEAFMESLSCESVDNLEMFNSVPPVLLEKCAALSVRPDAVKSLVQAMQALSGVYTDVGSSLEEAQTALAEDEAGEKSLVEVLGQKGLPPRPPALQDLQKELKKYEAAHQEASQTNTELHKAMNQHIPSLRLLQGPLDELRKNLPQPQLSDEDMSSLQTIKRLLGKVDEMRKQRISLEQQLRDLIQKDDITSVLVTTERYEMKVLFEKQMQKYDPLKGYIDQNLAAQENILKALTEANVQYANVRKAVTLTEEQWNSSVQSLVASYEAYEDLVKKAEEGKNFYQDLDKKTSSLLDRVKAICQTRDQERIALLEKQVGKGPPARPTAQKPVLGNKVPSSGSGPSSLEAVGPSAIPFSREDLPLELRSFPPDLASAGGSALPNIPNHSAVPLSWPPGAAPFAPNPFPNQRTPQLSHVSQAHFGQAPGIPPSAAPLQPPGSGYILPQQFQPGAPRGSTPVPSNPQNTSQMPPQGYMPAPWQQAPSAPFPVVPGGYTGLPQQTGPQSAPRPNVPGHQVPMPGGHFPQQMQTGLPQTTSAQQIPPGSQYPVPHPRQSRSSQIPTAAFPGQNQPPIHPGQLQPMMPGQGQPQQGPAPLYWPSMAPQTQSQPGLPAQPVLQPQRAALPVQAQGQPHSGPVNQFFPGQPPQNQPQVPMSHVPPFFPAVQSQQMPGSFQNPNKQAPVPQTTPQNPQMPYIYHPSNHHQMPPGPVPPNSAQAGPPHTHYVMGQPSVTTQFNPMFQQPVRPPQTQNLQPQNIPSSSGPVVPVMDNPNPPALAGILTPSPAQPLPQNQAIPGNVLTPSSTGNASSVPQPEATFQSSSLEPIHDKLGTLCISTQGEAPASGHPQPNLIQ